MRQILTILSQSTFAQMTIHPINAIIIGCALLTTSNASAQSQPNDTLVKTDSVVHSTTSMTPELESYIHMMDSLDAEQLKTFGYRIQIYSSSGPNARKDALQNQSDFLKLYSDYSAYTQWDYPNWVVRLGDYRTHLEAIEFHNEIKELYPASFIVKDEIFLSDR